MQKIKPVFAILILIFPIVFVPVLTSTAALAQCTWMDGLSIVQAFNNPRDYGWLRSWDPCLDADWMMHYCGIGLERCPLREQDASRANNPDPAARPAVNHAIRSDTCPSAHDVDCGATSRRSVERWCSLGGCALAPGPGCSG